MAKKTLVLFGFLIVLMLIALSFVGYRTMQFSNEMLALKNTKQMQDTHAQTALKDLEELREKVLRQSESLSEFSAQIMLLTRQLDGIRKQSYMPALELALKSKIFRQTAAQNDMHTVEGDRQRVSEWLERHEMFLDHVLKKSLNLVYNPKQGRVVVQNIQADSVFEQMGLAKGDEFFSINGRVNNNGAELRVLLVEPKDKIIVLVRNNKRLTLNVSYVESVADTDKIELNITKQQFNTAAQDLLATIKMAPAFTGGDVLGLEILELEDSSVFALMEFQPHDVIVKLNGERVNQSQFVSALKESKNALEFEFLRNNQPQRVSVKFSEN